jgi:hypothetical protein
MPVFILLFHVKPTEDNPRKSEVAGAYVNCLILRSSLDDAEEIALEQIEELEWQPITLEETYEVTEDDYKDDPKGLEVYQQVLNDGEYYSIHTYEKEGE